MTKTPIQKMIEKLEAMNKVLVGLTGEYTTLKDVRAFMAELLKTAHTYASEEQSQKPAAPADLWDELSKFVEVELRAASTQTHKPVIGFRQALNQVREILSKYRPIKALPVEPLALLADRKGVIMEEPTPTGISNEIRISIEKRIIAYSYAACEAKAKEYLTGLPDKK